MSGTAARDTRIRVSGENPGVVCDLMLSVLRWQRPTERCRESSTVVGSVKLPAFCRLLITRRASRSALQAASCGFPSVN